jgi:SpoVK/Ycf46/Vps4 family AAA+-type ATPase
MMRKKENRESRNQLRRTEVKWEWRKRYRVWDANRKIFLYPENWVEPELRLPTASRAALREVIAFCKKCDAVTKRKRKSAQRKGVRVLLTGKNRAAALTAAQILARDLGKNLYRVDLGTVTSKYIGETEKNLSDVFDAAENSGAILFFDEADALFGKRTEVKDSHDRYANSEVNYLLDRIDDYEDLVILKTKRRQNLDSAFLRRLRHVISTSS